MVIYKTIIFFFALAVSVFAIEDFIEKMIGHLKCDKDEYYILYTTGLIETINLPLTILGVLLWTGLYLINYF